MYLVVWSGGIAEEPSYWTTTIPAEAHARFESWCSQADENSVVDLIWIDSASGEIELRYRQIGEMQSV